MDSTIIIDYYNKFNEDKRLGSRHGQIEFINTTRFIDKYLPANSRLLDVGAGTGAYSCFYQEKGVEVHALELVKHNLSRLKQKNPNIHARLGNGMNLSKYDNDYFDVVLIFGPLYHLFSDEDKAQCLKEAYRVAKNGAYIFAAYVMNEYSIISYGFKDHHALEALENKKIDEDFHVRNGLEDLYDYVRLEDIDRINKLAGLEGKREIIFSPDGHANLMRESLKQMTDEEFRLFVDYQYHVATRPDLIGAGAHVVDVIRVEK